MREHPQREDVPGVERKPEHAPTPRTYSCPGHDASPYSRGSPWLRGDLGDRESSGRAPSGRSTHHQSGYLSGAETDAPSVNRADGRTRRSSQCPRSDIRDTSSTCGVLIERDVTALDRSLDLRPIAASGERTLAQPTVTDGRFPAVVHRRFQGRGTRQRGMRFRRTTRCRRHRPVLPAWLRESSPTDGA
jgi:hypothetical protein